MAVAVQALGGNAKYVKIEGNGPNALDFHIAFYIGQIAATDPDAYFHIISKDTGFDPLVRHLREKKILAQREKDLAEIPLVRISKANTIDEKIEAVVERLSALGHARPRKVQTLKNTINALFAKKLEEKELSAIVERMQQREVIVLENEKVGYRPPISQP